MSDAQDILSAPLPNPNPSGSDTPPEQSVPIDPVSLAAHYEQDDVDVRAIVRLGAIILGATVVACVVLWVVLRFWLGYPIPPYVQLAPTDVGVQAVEGPGLDNAPEIHLELLRNRQLTLLDSYGWIDRDAGVVHIPIDEAMNMLVEQGVPAKDGPAPTFKLAPAFRLDGSGGVLPQDRNVIDDEADE